MSKTTVHCTSYNFGGLNVTKFGRNMLPYNKLIIINSSSFAGIQSFISRKQLCSRKLVCCKPYHETVRLMHRQLLHHSGWMWIASEFVGEGSMHWRHPAILGHYFLIKLIKSQLFKEICQTAKKKSLGNVENLKYFGRIVTSQNWMYGEIRSLLHSGRCVLMFSSKQLVFCFRTQKHND